MTLSRPVTGTSRPIFPVTMYPGRAIPGRQKRVVRLGPMLVLEGELINPAHVPYWRVNNPTLSEFCFRMIGRADIEGSKSNVAMNAWLPQASYPCGNFSDTSSCKSRRTKGSIGHAFTVCIRTENQNQMSFYPFVLHEISVLVELILGHLRSVAPARRNGIKPPSRESVDFARTPRGSGPPRVGELCHGPPLGGARLYLKPKKL